jgi:hypothetical protein
MNEENMSVEDKKRIWLFYFYLMSVDKETVNLLNEWHRTWLEILQEYTRGDEIIQRDNITRRIPEHLDEEDKKKFELIRQGSSFQNEDFYKKYIEPEAFDIVMRRESSGEGAWKLEDIEYDDYDDLDEFDDDLDSLLSTPSIPALSRY